jgi:hypothetical protein
LFGSTILPTRTMEKITCWSVIDYLILLKIISFDCNRAEEFFQLD